MFPVVVAGEERVTLSPDADLCLLSANHNCEDDAEFGPLAASSWVEASAWLFFSMGYVFFDHGAHGPVISGEARVVSESVGMPGRAQSL